MLERVIVRVVSFCTRYSFAVVIMALVLGLGSTVYAVRHFAINTNISGLLSPDLPWRKREADYRKAFPQEVESILAVIEAPTPEVRPRCRKATGWPTLGARIAVSVASNPTVSCWHLRLRARLRPRRCFSRR